MYVRMLATIMMTDWLHQDIPCVVGSTHTGFNNDIFWGLCSSQSSIYLNTPLLKEEAVEVGPSP